MTEPDYSTWLTKEQAAAALNRSTKTVELFAKTLRLPQARWRRPSGGPELAVYDPEAVATLVQELRPGPPTSLVPPTPAISTNGNGHRPHDASLGLATTTPADEGLVRTFLEGLVAAVLAQSSESSEKSATTDALFLTLAEAAAVSGLPQVDLRGLIDEGTLPHRRTRRGGIRIRRRDLELL